MNAHSIGMIPALELMIMYTKCVCKDVGVEGRPEVAGPDSFIIISWEAECKGIDGPVTRSKRSTISNDSPETPFSR